MLDDGDGGFNLHWAWASGIRAGNVLPLHWDKIGRHYALSNQ